MEQNILETVKEWVWGPWLLCLMLAVGLFYTIKSGFFQIRGIRKWWKATAGCVGETAESGKKEEDDKDGKKDTESVSSFQAACTALAATVGTGNIAGVATALVAGGPGTIFWMWISSMTGMMTAYAENFLGVLYRKRGEDGQFQGGPMCYIEKGMGKRRLALWYAVCTMFASFGMGSMVQANSMADTLQYAFCIPTFWTAAILTGVSALVLWGGIGRITKVTEKLVPCSAGIYLILTGVVILANIKEVPAVFRVIIQEAFSVKSIMGGAIGYGISRGVFSNEAGLGSLSILHSSAQNTTPKEQGMWGIFDVFFDTILMCTLTATAILVHPQLRNLLCSTPHNVGGVLLPSSDTPLNGAALASWAISETVGNGGNSVIAFAMVCFAFATILGWYCLGSQAASYLTGGRLFLYRLFYLESIFFGCVLQLQIVWDISDIFNGMMAIPNLIALLALRKKILFSDYNIKQEKQIRIKEK